MQDLDIFGLKTSFFNLIKNVLSSGATGKKYSKDIICTYIFFLVQSPSL